MSWQEIEKFADCYCELLKISFFVIKEEEIYFQIHSKDKKIYFFDLQVYFFYLFIEEIDLLLFSFCLQTDRDNAAFILDRLAISQ
jgi:hypothetical protein